MNDLSGFRPLMFAVAYRMLGAVNDAEDVVQEAFIRAAQADLSTVRSTEAYLTTMVTRMSIDHLRAARRRREQYPGMWLPEPVVDNRKSGGLALDGVPERTAELAESLSLAFLRVLEALNPNERAAFLLHDVFGYAFDEIADALGQSAANCRQLASRARRRVRSSSSSAREMTTTRTRDRDDAADDSEELVGEFLDACRSGDIEGLVSRLAEDAVVYSDGGGVVPSARAPVRGAERVARLMVGIARKGAAHLEARFAFVNGAPGVVGLDQGRVQSVLSLHVDENGKIATICVVNNPEKLDHLAMTP